MLLKVEKVNCLMLKYFDQIDLPPFFELYSQLQQLDVKWNENQICMNAPQNLTHDTSFGTGRLLKEYKFGDEIGQNEVTQSLKDGNWHLCDIFVDTPFEELFHAIKSSYKIGRLRIMKSSPSTCLAWHQDPVPRLHYPIKTQEGCLMVIEDEVKHLEQDKWYLTHTTYSHTALNGSKDDRIHIVADIFP